MDVLNYRVTRSMTRSTRNAIPFNPVQVRIFRRPQLDAIIITRKTKPPTRRLTTHTRENTPRSILIRPGLRTEPRTNRVRFDVSPPARGRINLFDNDVENGALAPRLVNAPNVSPPARGRINFFGNDVENGALTPRLVNAPNIQASGSNLQLNQNVLAMQNVISHNDDAPMLNRLNEAGQNNANAMIMTASNSQNSSNSIMAGSLVKSPSVISVLVPANTASNGTPNIQASGSNFQLSQNVLAMQNVIAQNDDAPMLNRLNETGQNNANAMIMTASNAQTSSNSFVAGSSVNSSSVASVLVPANTASNGTPNIPASGSNCQLSQNVLALTATGRGPNASHSTPTNGNNSFQFFMDRFSLQLEDFDV